MKRSVPSKSFLIGEYLALIGGPAVVITHEPSFTPGYDPHNGAGGFGASTAEFLLQFQNTNPASIDSTLERYVNDPMHGDQRPSGFDLVAQCYGQSCVIRKKEKLEIENFSTAQAPLLLFQASHLPNRKTKTYLHLKQVQVNPVWGKEAIPLVEDFIVSFRARDWAVAGALLNQYSDTLRLENWVHESVQKERLEFLKLPGVLGVKGAGAMQTDAMWVLFDPSDPSVKSNILKLALDLGFRSLQI